MIIIYPFPDNNTEFIEIRYNHLNLDYSHDSYQFSLNPSSVTNIDLWKSFCKNRENVRTRYFALFDNSPVTITIEELDITCMGSTVLTYIVSGSFCKRLK
jgi:hypothetical protein